MTALGRPVLYFDDGAILRVLDRTVQVETGGTGGTVADMDQVQVLLGLGADPPEWATAALILHAWSQHCPEVHLGQAVHVAALGLAGRIDRVRQARDGDPVLALLARDPHPRVRKVVARHCTDTDASRGLLRILAVDPDAGVRTTVLRLPAMPEDALEAAARTDPDKEVREDIANWRRSLPEPVLDALVHDPHPDVRWLVAHREHLGATHRAVLASDPDPKVRAALAARSGT